MVKKKNSIDILRLNFINYKQLDNPSIGSDLNLPLFANPQGTALHWLAGNVPVISFISLFQGLLTKNKNVIKVSKTYKSLFLSVFHDLQKNIKIKKKFKKNFS